jgi:uncharacterized coiled-coil protein SlyX
MEPKNSKIFNKETMQAVSAFCDSQEIKDIDNFIYLCFKQGFDIKRYGLLGDNSEKIGGEQKKWAEKEVIVEKRVEIPVEVIKEVEKIVEVVKEVPVEKVVIKEVVKEVPVDRVVEKEIYITDDKEVNELGGIIAELRNEMSKKDAELDELRHSLDELLAKPPVEVIKEVEKIVEIPVEKIVTNVEYIRDENNENQLNEKLKLLQETLQSLRGELLEKNEQIKELEKINRDLLNGNQNQGYLLRGSNLNRRI